ncbi:hypothetical protein IGI04_043029 [Brassica rapa subsp. trilocularis]|uniref:Uncharacterized protein n=1 Tax=Brassica rapa subsp. trilocularis TaxID=1813537 RepID=A0ABQ7KHZ4_BRACM|nr:hypothetical protein IGI04_043029 [Brassica rapa subsp. trilocularis]
MDSARCPLPGGCWVILATWAVLFSTHRNVPMGVRTSTHRTSVAVCFCLRLSGQHIQNVCCCSCLSVWCMLDPGPVRQHTHDRPHADPSLGLLGDFGPRGLFVQYTKDVGGCRSAHIGRRCLSVCVCLCPSAHTGHSWLSISTHISTLILGLSTLALPVDCLGDFGPRGLSVQFTQDICGCPSAHTGHSWLSISTHVSTLVLGLSTLALPVDCLGNFGPRGLSVQYTKDVCGCPPAHTGRPWVSISTHRTTSVAVRQHTQDVCGCPCVSVSTHRTSVAVHQYTYQDVLGLSMLALPVDCSGDFGPRGLSVQYTQDICGCPSAYTGRPCVSVSTNKTSVAVLVCVCVCVCVSVSTHKTSVAIHQYKYQHVGPWIQHADPSRGLFGTHRTYVAVHQYTYQHVGPWTQYAGPSRRLFWVILPTWAVCLVHIGRPWVSARTLASRPDGVRRVTY